MPGRLLTCEERQGNGGVRKIFMRIGSWGEEGTLTGEKLTRLWNYLSTDSKPRHMSRAQIHMYLLNEWMTISTGNNNKKNPNLINTTYWAFTMDQTLLGGYYISFLFILKSWGEILWFFKCLASSEITYEFQGFFFYFYTKHQWNFGRNYIKSIDHVG